jgi:hypothetical protein
MVRPEGFEPPTNRFEADYSIQLSYGRKLLPKSSDQKSNDTCKCPVGHPGHFLVTPESPRFTPGRKSLIVLLISTIRTSDLDVRSQVLYPAELRARAGSVAVAGRFGNPILKGLPPMAPAHSPIVEILPFSPKTHLVRRQSQESFYTLLYKSLV